MSKRTSVKLIAMFALILCLVMAFGITAYADDVSIEEAPADIAINKADEAEQISKCNAPSELEEGQQNATLSDPASEAQLNDTQNDDRNPGPVSDQNTEPTNSETPTQSETLEPTQEPAGEGTAEEPDNNQTSENSGSDDGLEYSITISDVNGSSVDVTGGTQTLISDVLRNLGYEIGEDAIIEVDPDSVDTNVVNVSENGEGELVLTDNGPFGKAVKNLIVYVNGVAIELELVDPTELKGNKTAQQVQDAFGTAANPLNVKLTKNVTITDDASITLTAGVHDLYLNGKTLSGLSTATKTLFVISDGVTLNIYGGADADDTDGTGSIKGITTLFDVQTGGTLNIISGSIASRGETAVKISDGTVNVRGGILSGDCDGITVGGGTLNISGGTSAGGSTGISISDGTVNVSDGTILGATYGIYISGGKLNISGGNFNASDDICVDNGRVLVSGGDFNSASHIGGGTMNIVGGSFAYGIDCSGGSLNIAGGTFGSDPGNYILSGCTVSGTGTEADPYVVGAGSNIAAVINSGVMTGKSTVNEFKAAFGTDGTIVMLKDIEAAVTVSSGRTVTLNLNGKTLSASSSSGKARTITVTDNSVLTVTDSSADKLGKISASAVDADASAVLFNSTGSFTLNAGTLYAETTGSGTAIGLYSKSTGSVQLNGGNIKAYSKGTGKVHGLNISGGSIVTLGGSYVYAEGSANSGTAYGINNSGTGTVSVVSGKVEAVTAGAEDIFSIRSVGEGAQLIVSGGEMLAKSSGTGDVHGLRVANTSALTMSGGKVTAESTNNKGHACGVCSTGSGAVSITGGEVISTAVKADGNYALNLGNDCTSRVSISNASETVIPKFNGLFKGTASLFTVTGGKYSVDPSSFLEMEYAVNDITEAPYVYEVVESVAHDGTKGYASVRSAITANSTKATSEGDTVTVTMLKNSTENVIVPEDTFFILNLNGKTLSASGIAVTVKKTGNLTVTDNSADANGLIKATGTGSSAVAVKVADSAAFTLLKGTLSAATTGSGKAVGVYTVSSGSISLKGGKVESITTGTNTSSGVASSEECTGKITVDGAAISASSGSASGNTYGIIINGGSLEFNSGSVSAATDGNEDAYAIYSNKSVSVSGGNISAKATGNGNAHGIRVNKSGSAIVTGGTVKAESAGTGTACGICAINSAAAAVSGNPEVIAKSATAGNNRSLYAYGTGTFTVSGGRFNGPLAKNKGSFDIYGGKFSVDPTEFLGTAYAAWDIKEKPYFYEVKPDIVAYDDLHGYSSVQKAFNFNKDRAVSEATRVTVTMASNSQEDVTVKKGTFFTLDLNGKVLRGTGTDSVITVRGNLILTDSLPNATHTGAYASLPRGGIVIGGTGKSSDNDLLGGGVFVGKAGTFTMNGGTVTGNTADYGGGVYNKGTLTVTGGEISGNTVLSDDENVGGGLYVWSESNPVSIGGNVIISGNSNKSGKADNASLHDGAVLTVLDGFNGLVGVNSETAPNEYGQVPVTAQNGADYSGFFFSDNDDCLIGNNNNVVYLCVPVAEMDGTKYGFIQEAINAAGTEEKTIKLLNGSTENLSIGKDKKIILDLNGKFLHGDINVSDNGELTVIDESDSYGGVKGHLSKDNGAAIRLTAGVYSEMPNEAFLASGYQLVMNTDPETMDEYPFEVVKRYDIKLVDTTDEGCSAKIKIVGTVASIWVVDKDNKTVAPANVTILEPGRIMQLGAKTAEIRMTDKLTVVLDIKACMCGKSDCVITVDNENGVITVRCDGEAVFTADLTDILDKVAKLVYDGETLKAYDADGKLLKEFK